tara:strand:+ start:18595 stop:20295 length:1701 start_codon:yes stop_codon:yes gene_type:complete
MALVISDRIKETTNTVGTQTFQLEGAVTGFETFAANLSDGDTTYYAVTDNTNFEVGLGTINEGASQTINYTVTVVSDGGNKFALNGVTNPVITFVKGFTYVFDVSDNTNGSHPLRFRTSADASYTDGVSISGTQGQAGSTVTIVVASDAPSTLKYYCTSHGNAMGNTINVISAVATLARTTILASSNSNNAVSFGSGAKTIFCTLPAGKAVIKDASNNINGTFVGNITGNVTGNASGTAATVTGAAQTNITSVGTLTGLTIDGDATFTGANGNVVFDKSDDALEFADDVKAKFGTGGDLEVFHNGNNSFIKDTGTGALILSTNDLKVHDASVSDLLIRAIHTGATELYHSGSKKIETTSAGATVTGDLLISNSDADAVADPTITLYRNSSSPAFDDEMGEIIFQGRNNNSENINYGRIVGKIAQTTDGSEKGNIEFKIMESGTEATFVQMAFDNIFVNKQLTMFNNIFLDGNYSIKWDGATNNSNTTSLVVTDPTAVNTITLPDATGTVLTTGNSDTPTTTTSSSDADFVLIDDGGTMKKITPTNLGITAGAASLDDATALAIALG